MSDQPSDMETLTKRLVPCMVAYLSPFQIVNARESVPWNVEITDVNCGTWDYVELHKLVGGIDVGLAAPYHMVVARDGAVGLPALAHLRDVQAAVEFINRCFAALLLGGVYCEAIGPDGLDFGRIIDWTYLRTYSAAPARPNQFHQAIRQRQCAPLEAIHLMSPRSIEIDDLNTAMKAGRAILDAVPQLDPEFLLKGVTGYARRDWGAALTNLWIVVEQITSHLWEMRILASARTAQVAPGRIDQLSDTRTWTVSVRHELLHQIGIIGPEALGALAVARKARNALAHTGKHPTESDAKSAYSSALSLLELAAATNIPLINLDLGDHLISDPFLPQEPKSVEVSHWMAIPKLPGEAELEQLEAAIRRVPGNMNEPGT
jgi:hypothetical protein